ncbi:acyltransferase family protein [Dyella acidiphila]|uniref:Acyltransferase n=1 Tax=Dyella acidiphila TaxID=2775866 RepID=A0ABR9GD90_9GAMM|nr:acyltransferase [Dyella acidiphila]MBE1162013.1 acyltransferase [Dyella acidiphila]
MHSSSSSGMHSKNHYLILDGLRGVASLIVVMFHICEAYSPEHPLTQLINHGYLAVDFFFLLSGFVIAYAYDDRWHTLTIREFFKRRLIRLQPMVVMGMSIGAALFYFQAGAAFPLIAHTPVWLMLAVMLLGYTLLPLPMSLDIRGWGEMHPLDGPAWSLFFEYIANILYALGLRKLPNWALWVLVTLAAAFLVQLAVFGKQGDVIGGWSIDAEQLHIGFARLLFPFLAGMLLMRLGMRVPIRGAFALCSVLLIVALALPRFGGADRLWLNGLYESACVILVFPAIVAIGAGAQLQQGLSTRIAKWFGDLSYPLYITHYPLIYIYTQWVSSHNQTTPAAHVMAVGVMVLIASIAMAYACLKFYDEPVRRWLAGRFLKRG